MYFGVVLTGLGAIQSQLFKNDDEIFLANPFGFLVHLRVENHVKAWNGYHLPVCFSNSVVISLAAVALAVLLAFLSAYGVARMRFRKQHALRIFTSLDLFIPMQVIMIPLRLPFFQGEFTTDWVLWAAPW